MSKQKLAEMVMQKMQEKKEKEERNRPHREVLQLLVQFEVEDYNKLLIQIDEFTKQIQIQQQILNKMNQSNSQLENTGKKQYPRIIVKPEFIASQHVQTLVKQYYRKTSNTFLREDLLRKKQYDTDTHQFEEMRQLYSVLKEKQINIRKQQQIQHKTLNEKRVRNLKQDLRLRAIRQQQANIKRTIAEQKQKNKQLIAEYDLKKTNLHKRQEWAERLISLIQDQKALIEKTYNPVTYRDYLKKIFNIRTKNQSIQKHLIEATKKVSQIQQQRQKRAEFLQKNDNLFIQGKCTDSPSKKKRFSLGQIQKQKQNKSVPKHNSLLFTLKKTIFSEVLSTPSKSKGPSRSGSTVSKNKSFSTSIGRTTASSMKNLFGQTLKQKNFMNVSQDFKKSKASFKTAKLFS